MLSPKSIHPVRGKSISYICECYIIIVNFLHMRSERETSFASTETKQFTRSLTMNDLKCSSQDSGHDYSEIVSMETMGEGYGNYDEVPGRKHPVVENSVIYDEVASFQEEGPSKKTEDESTNDYIFMTQPQTTSGSSKPPSKTGGMQEARLRDWLSKLKIGKILK